MFKVFKLQYPEVGGTTGNFVPQRTPATKTKFSNYETARQWVRKQIRQHNLRDTDLFWTSNPMIGDYGYSIRKV